MTFKRDKSLYDEAMRLITSNDFTIDKLIDEMRKTNDRWSWCDYYMAFCKFVDSRSFLEYMVQFHLTLSAEPSEHHIENTRIDLILELFEKIKLQDNIHLVTYCITGCAPVRYYVQKEYIELKLWYNNIMQHNCFTNLHTFRIHANEYT